MAAMAKPLPPAKPSESVARRTRKGVTEYRLVCTRCGLVRWLPMNNVGLPHCMRGWFGFVREGHR